MEEGERRIYGRGGKEDIWKRGGEYMNEGERRIFERGGKEIYEGRGRGNTLYNQCMYKKTSTEKISLFNFRIRRKGAREIILYKLYMYSIERAAGLNIGQLCEQGSLHSLPLFDVEVIILITGSLSPLIYQ